MAEGKPRGSGRVVGVGLVVFLLAVLMGRLLMAPGDLWKFFVIALPVLLILLSLVLGFVRAVALVAFFACTVLAVRWLVLAGPGWPIILLVPVLALSLMLVLRVLAALRNQKRDAEKLEGEGEVEYR